MACNCFTGFPCEDTQGNCTCVADPALCNTGGVKPIPTDSMIFPQMRRYWQKKQLQLSQPAGSSPQCAHLQAPKGYRYISTDQGCVLSVDYDSDTSIFKTAATPASGGGSTIDDLLGGITGSDFIQQNKGLLLLGGAGVLAYFMLGKGLRPKSRLVTSTTKY